MRLESGRPMLRQALGALRSLRTASVFRGSSWGGETAARAVTAAVGVASVSAAVLLAPAAHATAGPSASISGYDSVQTWVHDRPSHGPFAAGNMTWFVLPPSQAGAPPRLLRTSFLQFGLGPHHFDVNDGQRDFHSNFTLDIESELAPPAGVTCVPGHASAAAGTGTSFFF